MPIKYDKFLSVRQQILEQIKQKSKNGFIWSTLLTDNFKRNDIDVALHTFAKKGIIKKIINGLYYTKPRKKPSIEDTANTIMLKNGFNGVTTNDPTIYLAAIAKTLKYNVCGQILTFKATSPKKLAIPQKIRKEAYFYLRLFGDEAFSPPEAVNLVVPHVKRLADKLQRKVIVWCCADTEESNYVKILSRLPYCHVVHTHIFDGFNFLTDVPDFDFDCIITNPPYKGKRLWVEKCMSYGKPFALFLPATWLNDTAVNEIFHDDLQLLIPDKRTQFIRKTNDKNSCCFKAIYYCKDFLDKPIVQAKLQ